MTIKQILRECEVFSALTESDLEKIASLAQEKQFQAGTTIFQEGDHAEDFFVIEEGKVALQMALPKIQGERSRKTTVDITAKNEAIGWSAIVEPHIYTLTAVCLQEVKALAIKGVKLKAVLQDNPKIGYEVLKELIKVVASRLDETRRVLVSERSLTLKPE